MIPMGNFGKKVQNNEKIIKKWPFFGEKALRNVLFHFPSRFNAEISEALDFCILRFFLSCDQFL